MRERSISLFCTGEIALIIDLGLIDMFSANQTTEIVACMLLALKQVANNTRVLPIHGI